MALPSKLFCENDDDDQDGIAPEDKHKTFIYRNDSKLHSFSRDEAPWPFCYNRETLEQCALDHALILKITNTQSFIDFKGRPPKRCLDLGTALGDWVVDTAQRFPECTLIGFDLVDVQIPLKVLEPSVAERIEWVHGNFLTHRLPFKANEFDWIHLEGIALAVPENKWHWLFGELQRVLAPGGIIEILQQDALFPVLPRWFTDPLHAHLERRTPILPGRERQASLPRVSKELPHVHALLEELFYAVFESRFINPTPSSILPDYFATIFRHVQSPPILRFPMPPIPPLVPRMDEMLPLPLEDNEPQITNDPTNPSVEFIPAPGSSASSVTSMSCDADAECVENEHLGIGFTRPSMESSRSGAIQLERSSSFTFEESSTRLDPQRRHSVATLTPSEMSGVGDRSVSALFRTEMLQAMPRDNLFMHLYQAVRTVLAMKEAMWDELKKKVDVKDSSLTLYGWDEEDYETGVSREKFEALLERYRGDMQVRMSLWYSLVKAGWSFPRREPLTTLELEEEEKLRQAILEARKNAKEEEFATPTRSVRLLIGIKD